MPIIGPSVMTDANCEGFPIYDRITENDRWVIKIIGIHCICFPDPRVRHIKFNQGCIVKVTAHISVTNSSPPRCIWIFHTRIIHGCSMHDLGLRSDLKVH